MHLDTILLRSFPLTALLAILSLHGNNVRKRRERDLLQSQGRQRYKADYS